MPCAASRSAISGIRCYPDWLARETYGPFEQFDRPCAEGHDTAALSEVGQFSCSCRMLTSLAGCGPKSDLLPVVTGECLSRWNSAEERINSIHVNRRGKDLCQQAAAIKDGEFDIPQAKGLLPGTYHIMISAVRRKLTDGHLKTPRATTDELPAS